MLLIWNKWLKSWVLIYPTMFIFLMFAYSAKNAVKENNNIMRSSKFITIRDTNNLFREEIFNESRYIFVYEKETDIYLVYKEFKCLGVVILKVSESIVDFSCEDLLQKMIDIRAFYTNDYAEK